MYHFSWDPNATTKFGLAPLLMEEEDGTLSTILSAGYWNRRETTLFLDVLADPRTTVVNDPQKDDVTVATNIAYLDRLVVILTYGHALLDHWKTKTNQIYCNLFLPLWTLEEASRASQLLRFEPIRTCGHLFDKYGGCIRGWLEGPCSTEESLVSKAQNVVTNHGGGLLKKTHDSRGGIVHVRVKFDETRRNPYRHSLIYYGPMSSRQALYPMMKGMPHGPYSTTLQNRARSTCSGPNASWKPLIRGILQAMYASVDSETWF